MSLSRDFLVAVETSVKKKQMDMGFKKRLFEPAAEPKRVNVKPAVAAEAVEEACPLKLPPAVAEEVCPLKQSEKHNFDPKVKKNPIIPFIYISPLKYVEKALNTSTLHRLGRIFNNESLILRIILGVVFMASFGYCTYQIISTIITYSEYNIVTTTSIKYEIPAEFPVVQFCNLNQFDESTDNATIWAIVNDGTVNLSNYDTAAYYTADVNEYFRAQLIKKSLNGESTQLAWSLDFDITQMLISCRFKDTVCSHNDFFEYYDYYYGLCYRFNQGRDINANPLNISKVGVPGVKYGLQLELYAGYADEQEMYTVSRGFRISIFNKSSVDQIALEQGIDVSTGFNTNIEVQRTVLTHLASPYGSCLPTDITEIDWTQNVHLKFMYDNYIDGSYFAGLSDPYTGVANPNWNWTQIYSQFFCLKLCYQKYLYEQCGCYDITIPMTPKHLSTYTSNTCVSASQISCMNTQQLTFYEETSLFGVCYDDCPIECRQIDYNLKVTTSLYPTRWYGALLAQSEGFNAVVNVYFNSYHLNNITYIGDYTELRNSVAKVNVFYDDLSYTQIDETAAMTFDTFLGNIGGNMGLFLGASLMTFTEIFELIFLIIRSQIKKLYFDQILIKQEANVSTQVETVKQPPVLSTVS